MISQPRIRVLAAAGLLLVALQLASAAPRRNAAREDDDSYEGFESEAPRRSGRVSGITDDGEGLSADSDLRRMLELDTNGRETNFPTDEADDNEEADDEQSASNLVDSISTELYREPHMLDTNIENAKIQLTPQDMAAAAGHHHHHKHYVHGKLEMGAETGKKGSFKWHDKHPVGGKGRR